MQITTVLTNAQPRTVNKRDGSGSFNLYELFDHEGNAWVVRKDVFDGAQYLIGQTVDMIVRVEQNGQWTNRFADIITPSQNAVPVSNTAVLAMQAAQAAQRAQPPQQTVVVPAPQAMVMPGWGSPTQPPMVPNTIGGMGQPQLQDVSVFPTRKDSSINRQTAAKVACQISTSPGEFWANCVDLARYFDTGQTPMAGTSHPANPPQPQAQYAATTTGYGDNAPPHTDDDIPF